MKHAYRILGALAAMAMAGTRQAPESVRKQAEASMLLTGTIEIEADGSVRGYGIDHEDKVPGYVLANIAKWVPAWRFSRCWWNGKAVPARTRMSLRMAAEPSGEDSFSIYIAGAGLGEKSGTPPTDAVTVLEMKPPNFPRDVVNMGGKGIVCLVLEIGRQGTVEDVVAEQVNLTAYASEPEMKRTRRSLAAAAVKRAREWTFNIPTTGERADEESWSLRVPVDFAYHGDKEAGYGQWEGYLPGPRTRAAWLVEGDDTGNDAPAGGDVHMVGAGPRLLTPPREG